MHFRENDVIINELNFNFLQESTEPGKGHASFIF